MNKILTRLKRSLCEILTSTEAERKAAKQQEQALSDRNKDGDCDIQRTNRNTQTVVSFIVAGLDEYLRVV